MRDATSRCVHHGSAAACNIGAPHAWSSPICTPVRPNARRTARSPGARSAPNEPQPGEWSVVRDSGATTPPSLEQPTSDDASTSLGKTQPSAAARQLRSFAPATPTPTRFPTRSPTRSPTTPSPTFAPLAPTTQAPGAQKQIEELSYDPATNPSLDAWLRPLLNKPWAVVVNLPPNQQLRWLPCRLVTSPTRTSTSRYDAVVPLSARASPWPIQSNSPRARPSCEWSAST